MNERNWMILGGLLGAVVGMGAGFVLFTERGRMLRAELQPEIEAIVRDAMRVAKDVGNVNRDRRAANVSATADAPVWPRRTT